MTWTLLHGSSERTLADWGISGVTRRRSSQAADSIVFDLDGRAFDGLVPFDPEDEITIRRDGAAWFVGRVTAINPQAAGNAERISITAEGPWWYLERMVFQQVWIVRGETLHASHCLLNTRPIVGPTPLKTAEQIGEALQWASDQAAARFGSAPFQWDAAGFPDVQVPSDEVRDITCAEVIRKQLRWLPDAVTWWDYGTTPPTFRCRRRADLTPRNVTIGSGITAFGITPRHDLVVPAVVLKYERTDDINGASAFVLATDSAPADATGTEFGALCATIDLQPFQVSTTTATIEAKVFPGPTDREGWWAWLKAHEPWLADPAVTLRELVFVGSKRTDDPTKPILPRELIVGPLPAWLAKSSQQETVGAIVRLSIAGDNEAEDVVTKSVSINVVTTDAISGSYSTAESIVIGEAAPIGLAQALYDALSVLEYQGQITFVLEELTDAVGLGDVCNLTGGRAEWSTMNAVVQEVAEAIDTGTTTIQFGPPQHLGPRDLIELLRINRFRQTFTPASARSGAGRSGAGSVGIGGATPTQNATSGSTTRERLKIAVAGGSIDLDASLTVGHPMTVQEVSICLDGVQKRMLIMASEPFD